MKPVKDPNSTKYPDRVFFAGQWHTPEGVERQRASSRTYNYSEKGRARRRRVDARRIRLCAGGLIFHVGYAPTVEQAEYLRRKIREEAPNGRTIREP